MATFIILLYLRNRYQNLCAVTYAIAIEGAVSILEQSNIPNHELTMSTP